MKTLREFAAVFFAFLLVSPCLAQQPGVVVVNASSKELKRAAHRLRIPVEQLKNARQTLQEATDLAKKIEPCPTEQFFNLLQSWTQLDKTKSKFVLESLMQDLRSEAADCDDYGCYQRVTSAGMSLLQSNADFDYEKVSQWMRNWPEPKASAGDTAKSFRETMETQLKQQALTRLAASDPDKALELLSELGDKTTYGYSASAQVAQGLMNAGKKDEALRLIDTTIQNFDPSATNGRALQDYEIFVRSTVMSLDSSRASTAVAGLITALVNQNSSGHCGATLKSGDTSLDLTCAESTVLNLVRSFPMRPGFTLKTLETVPGLKSKLDSVGGIDAFYGGTFGSGLSISYNVPSGPQGSGTAILRAGAPTQPVDISKLIQELKGKDAAYIKGKLRDLSIDVLLPVAMSTAYQDPDTATVALEIAQQLLPQVDPLQRRASVLQSLIQAYRQVDGEVDPSLLKSGFVLADDLRQEFSKRDEAMGKKGPVAQFGMTQADQLEAALVAELSRTSYDSAMRYVRSMENSTLKLACMLQVVQAQSQPNF